jgi:NAD(P)-dependent dehydrogenase (short-subunit alcohol dehydrogenase family)
MKLDNKVAVITGGNSGIGLAIAKRYQQEGAKVAVMGRNADTLAEAASALGAGALIVKGDVTSVDDVAKLFKDTEARFGKIDVVVANAGVAKMAPAELTDEATFDLISDINFKGLFFTVQKALPHLNDGASVVFTGSAVSYRAMPGMSVYAATKAAVRSLARSFAVELAPRKIRVNVLSPGPIETPLFGKVGATEEQLQGFSEQLTNEVALGRFGQPDEMANVALFLASADSSFVTGSDLVADGGWSN